MLDGDIQILDDLRLGCDGLDQLLVDLVRVDVVQSDPVESLDGTELPKKLGQQPLAVAQVGAVAAGVLGDHDHLLHALMGQDAGLIEHIVQVSGAELAPQGGDHAVGALVVAALGNFQVGIVLGGGQHTAALHLGGVDVTEVHHLAVIQQRYDPLTKKTWWTNLDEWLTDDLYLHPGFKAFFDERAGEISDENLYPTVTVRQIMWALRMKPIPREPWETVFDRRDI